MDSKWTKMYNREAHRALANEGLAPQLYRIRPHSISLEWVEVFMEKLGPEWLDLEECASRLSADDWRRACYAVELAMERAQRIELPDGKLLVTQGTSARFIRIKVTPEHIEVKFTGYEMMEWEGRAVEEAIPTYLHPLHYEHAPLRQKDTRSNLEQKLRQISRRTRPLPPYPYPPPDGRLLVHASMTHQAAMASHRPNRGAGFAGVRGGGAMRFLAH